jgi:parallel beta-helix repeat protein
MRRHAIIAALAVAVVFDAGSAWAQAARTFVSGFGSDANPCSLTAPCRSFAQAITQTNAGGEITVLDPAGYGPVTITKSVSIVNDGVGEAGVTTSSAVNAITIEVGLSDVVNLRGLTLVGGGVGSRGIDFITFGTLNMQNCVVRGFTVDGIGLYPIGSAQFNISDTIVSSVAFSAIDVNPGGTGAVTALFNRVQATGSATGINVTGISASGTINATISNSTASNNGHGIAVSSNSGQAVTEVMVVASVLANNTDGVVEGGANSTTFLAKDAISGNGTAFIVSGGGALFSFGDNDIKTNGNDGGTISLVSTK